MANLKHVTCNKLTKEADQQQRNSRIRITTFGVLLAVVASFIHIFAAIPVLIITFMFFLSARGDDTLRAGAIGEDIAMKVLSQLPDTYTLYNQVDIPNPKSRAGFNEADIIVHGPNGVFVVEVKQQWHHLWL